MPRLSSKLWLPASGAQPAGEGVAAAAALSFSCRRLLRWICWRMSSSRSRWRWEKQRIRSKQGHRARPRWPQAGGQTNAELWVLPPARCPCSLHGSGGVIKRGAGLFDPVTNCDAPRSSLTAHPKPSWIPRDPLASPHLPLLLQLRRAHGGHGPVLAAGQLGQVPVWGCREPRSRLLPLISPQGGSGQEGDGGIRLLGGRWGLLGQHRGRPEGREAVGGVGSPGARPQGAAGLVETGGRGVG